jgi:hypothetical protein
MAVQVRLWATLTAAGGSKGDKRSQGNRVLLRSAQNPAVAAATCPESSPGVVAATRSLAPVVGRDEPARYGIRTAFE